MKKLHWQTKVVAIVMIALMTSVQAQPPDVAPSDAANAVLKKMRAEKISPQKAWDDGLLTKEILVFALNEEDLLDPGLGLWHPGEETRAWTQLVQDKLPDLWKSPAPLGKSAQVRLALTMMSQGDARGAEIMEKILAAMPRENPDITPVNDIIHSLFNYYCYSEQNDKAVAISLKIKEYTKEPSVIANLLLGAARVTYAEGDIAGANRLYQEVIGYGYGWATGWAYYDMAGYLFREGKQEEGRALLKKPIEGHYADQIRVVLNQRLAQSYFDTGEWEQARKYARATVDQYKRLANPLKDHGLEWIVESAQSLPQQIEQWEQSPVHLMQQKIALRAEKDFKEPLHTYFQISSYRSITVKAVSQNPHIKAWPLLSPGEYESENNKMMGVEIGPEAFEDDTKIELVVTIEEFPDLTFRIPITVGQIEKTTTKKE